MKVLFRFLESYHHVITNTLHSHMQHRFCVFKKIQFYKVLILKLYPIKPTQTINGIKNSIPINVLKACQKNKLKFIAYKIVRIVIFLILKKFNDDLDIRTPS